ncbi:MAG: hypothetical protein K2O11_05175, partial [Oscillospiraceae bacterium]|nr:hypothetical protein [Oscillospiraceae bacterium]
LGFLLGLQGLEDHAVRQGFEIHCWFLLKLKCGAVVSSGLRPEWSKSGEALMGPDGFCGIGGLRTASRTGAACVPSVLALFFIEC